MLPVACRYQGVKFWIHPSNETTRLFQKDIPYEPHVFRYFKEVIPGAVFLDVGANVGIFSILAASLGARKVIAVDPSDENIRLIRRSALANGFYQVQGVCAAASDTEGGAIMAYAGLSSGGELDPNGNVTVSVKRLDNVTEEQVDVIKMDIEGCEMRAVRGMPRLLAGRPIVFSEFYPRLLCKQGTEPRAYLDWWFNNNYHVFDLDVQTQAKVPCASPEAVMERFGAKRDGVSQWSRRLVYLDLLLEPGERSR